MPLHGFSRAILGAAFAVLALTWQPAAAVTPEGKKSAESSNSPYLIVDPLPLSIIRDGAQRGMLIVEIGIDTKSLDERQVAEHLMPRLMDLYVQTLNLYVTRDLPLHKPPDVEIVRNRLQEATDMILGKDKGTVLLRQILVRRSLPPR